MAGITLRLINPGKLDWAPAQAVIAQLAESPTDLPQGAVNVKIVDEQEITALNTQYTGNAYATDVLSVSYIEDGQPVIADELGDIAICLAVAQAAATKGGSSLEAELALLTLHGTLHILGHDHQTKQEQQQMDQLQQTLMTQAGLPYRDFLWQQ
jgi:probable rRNA maturation factor